MIQDFLDSIQVKDVGLTKVRVGNKHDGGYVALEEICEKTKAIYSFGVGDDVGFELDFTKKFGPIKVDLFDPTINKMPEAAIYHLFCNFYKQGIGSDYPVPTNFIQDSLLKIDVEWHEWAAFDIMSTKELLKFNQILAEFHIIPIQGMQNEHCSPYFDQFYGSVQDEMNKNIFSYYTSVMNGLTKHFHIFHIHANNSLPKTEVNGISFPPLIELSLVRKDLVKDAQNTKDSFPVEGLDFPNKTDRPDITNIYPLGS